MSGVSYLVTVHEEDDQFWAEVAELPGCFALGETIDELWDSLAEAMSLYLSTPGMRVHAPVSEQQVTPKQTKARVLVDC